MECSSHCRFHGTINFRRDHAHERTVSKEKDPWGASIFVGHFKQLSGSAIQSFQIHVLVECSFTSDTGQ
jgi:hypothetical protein